MSKVFPIVVACNLRAACLLSLLTMAAVAQDFSSPQAKPDPSAALVQQANDALTAGDLPTALKLLTSLNKQTPHNAQILYDIGLTLEALETTPASSSAQPPATDSVLTPESCYRQAIAADPNFPAPQVALGLLLARTNRPAEAHTELLGAANLPSIETALKARAWRALAKLDMQSNPPNSSAASDELLAALKINPEQPNDILLAAEIAESAPDLPAAEKAFRRYLALPGMAADPQATSALAHVLLKEHRPADAEALLGPALAHSPNDPGFTAQLANVYLSSGDPSKIVKATPLMESLHARNPDNAEITRLLARIYVETGHDEQAEPLYAALLAAQSDHADVTLLDDRARTLIHLHRPAEAEKLLKQAIANPGAFPSPDDFAEAAMHLAIAAEEIDDPRMALQALALRATVQQPTPSSLYLEATANDDLHQTTQAVELYKQFLTAAHGALPAQESQAKQRLAALQHRK